MCLLLSPFDNRYPIGTLTLILRAELIGKAGSTQQTFQRKHVPPSTPHASRQMSYLSPHFYSFAVLHINCALAGRSVPRFLPSYGDSNADICQGGRAAKWAWQTVVSSVLKSAGVSGGQIHGLALKLDVLWHPREHLFMSVLVGPTMVTRQWKTLSDGGAGRGEELRYK